MFDPNGMRPFIEGWEQVAATLLQRVNRESVGHVTDGRTLDLLRSLDRYPDVIELGAVRHGHGPVLPITFVKGGERHVYFSLFSIVGTPQSLPAQELRIECMFPADPE